MKKIICIIFALAFILCSATTVMAAESVDSSSFSASGSTSKVTVSGKVVDNSTAVFVALFDTDGTTTLRAESVAVKSDKSFTVEFDNLSLKKGSTYTVKAAQYEGGDWTSTTFVVSSADTPKGDGGADTGDSSNMILWIVLACIALAGIGGVILSFRKRSHKA